MDPSTNQSPSLEVVTAVARAEGTDPTELQPPLWDVVDPEALDRLFQRESPSLSVTFEYRGYTVAVDGTGDVRIETAPERVRTE